MGPARDLKFNRFVFFTGPVYASKVGPTLIRFRAREKLTSLHCARRIFAEKLRGIDRCIDRDKNITRIILLSRRDLLDKFSSTRRENVIIRHKEICINEITTFPEGESAETGETRVRYYLFEEYWIADPGKYHFFRRKLNLTFLACPFILMGQRSILVASNCRRHQSRPNARVLAKGGLREIIMRGAPPVALDLNHLEYKIFSYENRRKKKSIPLYFKNICRVGRGRKRENKFPGFLDEMISPDESRSNF